MLKKRLSKSFFLWLLIWGVGSQAVTLGEPAALMDADRFELVVNTPEPSFTDLGDGYHQVLIEGFETWQRLSGAPDLPTKTLLVALPPGAVPRLEVRVRGESLRRGIRPRPVPRRVLQTPNVEGDEGARRAVASSIHVPDKGIYEGEEAFPERVAWLGETGAIRDQRYVALHLAPLRYDAARSGLLVAAAIEVVIHFDGATALGSRAPHDPRFEAIYRGAFVNYEQSLLFRQDAPAVAVPAAASQRAFLSTPIQKILVREHGLVRLDYDRMNGTGFLAHDLSLWRLSNRGTTVPLQVQDDGDGVLEPGEWLQFYGSALDDEPKTALNTDLPGTDFDLFEARDFTDTNVYFLTVELDPQAPMDSRDATPTFSRTPPDHFADVAHEEVDNSYKPLGPADPWYWGPTLIAGSPTYGSRSDPVALPGLHGGTFDATVRVNAQGRTEALGISPNHVMRVTLLNGSGEPLATEDGLFDNRTIHLLEFTWTWPGSGPELSGPAEVQIEAVPVSGASNQFVLDYFEIVYRRSFTVADESLTFEWPDGDAEFLVGGLQDPAPAVYEITLLDGEQVVRPVALAGLSVVGGAPPYSVRFRVDNDPGIVDGTPRRFLVAGVSAISVPANPDFIADTVSDLRDHANDADLVVIAHPDLVDLQPASDLSLLLDHRATPQGGGLTSKVALLGDVEDEFNYGLPGPLAIREFLRWVLSDAPGEGWAVKPSHVLLLGDGSFDYKGVIDQGNYVPTQMIFKDDPILGFYASDSVMGAVVGADSVPDLHVGRIPARTLGEAEVMLRKILDSEESTPPGDWNKRALFVSDRGKTGNNPAEALEFEMVNTTARSYMDIPPYESTELRYWTDYYEPWTIDPGSNPDPASTMKADIKAEVNAGKALVQFIGHGNSVVWSDDAFFDERFTPRDSEHLTNGTMLPWLLAHNCLTGSFHSGENSLGANWLKLDGGGAAGVFSPTGLSFNFIGLRVTEVLWEAMFGAPKERFIGPLEMQTRVALCGQGSVEACQQYVVLGDPATRLTLRSVAPATNVQAVAANAHVDLSWDVSETPGAVYDVYRNHDLQFGSYVKVNTAPVALPFYLDDSVINARTYYYYVVAVDADGFESAWSNFNSDCGVSGPDCLSATPLNPDPPSAPTGVALIDPGLGNQLQVSWAANPESDIDYYTVHYGLEPGVYTATETVDGFTTRTLMGLIEGQPYYVAVSATNSSALTSALSNEMTEIPVFAPGLRPPALVADLTVSRSGDDLLLGWTEIDTDTFGKPAQVQTYEIFRGDGPLFDASGMVKIAECASPCDAYLDDGAFASPTTYRYRVRALDAEGTPGGLGAEPPASTALDVGKPDGDPSAVVLSWVDVTVTTDGKPVDLSHYEVYASDQPFSRADIRDGLLPAPTIVAETELEFTPPTQNRYYSVLAVDIRGNTSPF